MMVSIAGGLCPFGQWEQIIHACTARMLGLFSDFCNWSLRAEVVFLCDDRPDFPGALLPRSRRRLDGGRVGEQRLPAPIDEMVE